MVATTTALPLGMSIVVQRMIRLVVDIVDVGHPKHGNGLVIGEALQFHVDEALLDGTRVDQAALRAVGRHAGNTYSRATDLFEIERPA